MDLVTILRELSRLRVFVAIVALVAVLAGLLVAFKLPSLESRRYESGVATARILVDTPRSVVVGVAPKGSDTLGIRASLLSNLMVTGVVRANIAEKVGLEPKELQGIAESSADPSDVAKPEDPSGPALTTRVLPSTDGDLPLIELEAQNSDAAGAARLANAAVEGLREYLDTKAAREEVKEAQRLRVTGLGEALAGETVRGPSPLMAFAVGIFVFVLGCGAILALSMLARSWRTASAVETLEPDTASDLIALDGFFDLEEEPAAEQDWPKRGAGAGRRSA